MYGAYFGMSRRMVLLLARPGMDGIEADQALLEFRFAETRRSGPGVAKWVAVPISDI